MHRRYTEETGRSTRMNLSDEWGGRLDWQPHPNEAVYHDRPPATGLKLANGNIRCTSCGAQIPDNSGQGLLASCPHCWRAVAVAQAADNAAGRKPDRATGAWLDLFGVNR
jgi:phage FluMu protein Com